MFLTANPETFSALTHTQIENKELDSYLNSIIEEVQRTDGSGFLLKLLEELNLSQFDGRREIFYQSEEYRQKRRMVSPYWFDYYFSNDSPKHIIFIAEASQIQHMIQDDNYLGFESILHTVLERAGIGTIVEYVVNNSHYSVNVMYSFLKAISSAPKVGEERVVKFLHSPYNELFECWVNKLAEDQVLKAVSQFIKETHSVGIVAWYLYLARSYDKRFDKEIRQVFKVLKAHEQELSAQIIQTCDELGDSFFNSSFLHCIFVYKEFGDYEIIQGRINSYCQEDSNLLSTLENMGSYHTDNGVKKYQTPAPYYMDVFSDYDDLENRLKNTSIQHFSERSKEVVEACLDEKFMQWCKDIRESEVFARMNYKEAFNFRFDSQIHHSAMEGIKSPDIEENHILLPIRNERAESFISEGRKCNEAFFNNYYDNKWLAIYKDDTEEWGRAFIVSSAAVEYKDLDVLYKDLKINFYIKVRKNKEFYLMSPSMKQGCHLGYSNELIKNIRPDHS